MKTLLIQLCLIVFATGGCANPYPGQRTSSNGISQSFVVGWERIEQAYADLDHDGVNELFLGNPSTRGNAGLDYLVLKKRGGKWWPMGELFLHPDAFRILPKAADGSIRVIRYRRLGGQEGFLETLTYRDGAFVVLSSEPFYAGDGASEAAKKRYQTLFLQSGGPDQRLQLTDGDARNGE